MKHILFFSLIIISVSSCKKEETEIPGSQEQWEKYIGAYHVYDTMGLFMYNAEISHFSAINQYGTTVDTLVIENFADTMDLKMGFMNCTDPNYLLLPFYDSITDYNQKSWYISQKVDDTLTTVIENKMYGNTMTLYFRMTNLKYYINESVPYFDQNCKHVYVKY